jgi:hypothetical protein
MSAPRSGQNGTAWRQAKKHSSRRSTQRNTDNNIFFYRRLSAFIGGQQCFASTRLASRNRRLHATKKLRRHPFLDDATTPLCRSSQ